MATPQNTTIATIGLTRGLFATAVVLTAVYLIAAVVLRLSGFDIAFAQYVLSDSALPSLYWVPDVLADRLASDTFLGTLSALLVAGLNALLITGALASAGFLGGAAFYLVSRHRQHASRQDTSAAQNTETRQILQTPSCVLSIYDYSGSVLHEPAPEAHLWLLRTPMRSEESLNDGVERLQLALLEILEAHADWSCDPAGHHASVGLKQHSVSVAERMSERMPDEPLAPCIGLAHDLGKILAYQQEPGPDNTMVWVKTSRQHDHLSAHIVRTLPEFQALPFVDRRIISAVMAYAHSNDTPMGLIVSDADDVRIRALVGAIRVADGLTTRDDQLTARDALSDPGIREDLISALPAAIFALNVNRSIDPKANAEGFTSIARGYVAVQEAALRERLIALLPENTQVALALRAKPLPKLSHPAVTPIAAVLAELGLLIEAHEALAPDPALFDILSGNLRVTACFLLSRKGLSGIDDGRLALWGDNPYPLRVLSPR